MTFFQRARRYFIALSFALLALAQPMEARADPTILTITIGPEVFEIKRADILPKPVMGYVLGSRANLSFCIHPNKMKLIAGAMKRHSDGSIKVQLLDQPGETRTADAMQSFCQFWGNLDSQASQRLSAYLKRQSDDPDFFPGPALSSNSFCPEAFFIEVCVKSSDPHKTLFEMRDAQLLRFEEFGEGEFAITPQGATGIEYHLYTGDRIIEDVRIRACQAQGFTGNENEAICSGKFPLLEAALPFRGYSSFDVSHRRREHFHREWLHEDGNRRHFFSSTVGLDGREPNFIYQFFEIGHDEN
ncbi:MAG: hypothetical protein AAGE89_01935 [Pseudomonadota bacterium]